MEAPHCRWLVGSLSAIRPMMSGDEGLRNRPGWYRGNGQFMPKYPNPPDPVQHSRRMAQPVMFPGPPIDISAQFQPRQPARGGPRFGWN